MCACLWFVSAETVHDSLALMGEGMPLDAGSDGEEPLSVLARLRPFREVCWLYGIREAPHIGALAGQVEGETPFGFCHPILSVLRS